MNTLIKPGFWSDNRMEQLNKDQKLAIVWLLTNAWRDLCGFTQVTPRRFTFDTELPIGVLDEACRIMGPSFMVLPGGTYFATRFVRHQFGKGGDISLKNNIVKAATRHAMALPATLRDAFFAAYPELACDLDASPHENADERVPHETARPLSPFPAKPSPSPSEKTEPLRVEKEKGQEKEQEQEKGNEEPISAARVTGAGSDDCPPPSPPPPQQQPCDPVSIAGLYPRRQAVQEAVTHIARAIAEGVDPRTIAEGTRAIAAVIRQLPSGHLNAYVPSAGRFFEKRRWEDDPQTWIRHAQSHGHRAGANGGRPPKLSLGGRAGTTIKIGT